MKTRLLLLAAILLLACAPLACNNTAYKACVITQEAYYKTSNSAQLNGWLDDLGGSARAEVWFSVEKSGSYIGDTPRQTLTAPGAFSYGLTNLDPETTYTFTAYAKGENAGDDDEGHGKPLDFTTLAEVALPMVTTGDATDVTSESATLHGEVVSMGMASELYVSIELGTTSGGPYNLIFTGPGTFQSPGPFSVDASLTPETTYYYRAVAASTSTLSVYGEEKHFTTTKGAELTILSHQQETDHATYYTVTGQAQNTGTKLLEQAQLEVVFKDAVGGEYYDYPYTGNLGLGQTWTWEATCPPGVDFSTLVSYQVRLSYIYPAT